MRIALAQINPAVGDIPRNVDAVKSAITQAAGQGADLVVFSELVIAGYPPKDLLLKPRFIDDNLKALHEIAQHCTGCAAVAGFVDRNETSSGKSLHNAAAFLYEGKVKEIYYKRLLPTYDVFDEHRYFKASDSNQVFTFKGKRFGLTICEDIWQSEDGLGEKTYDVKPMDDIAAQNVDFVINMSASPFTISKHAFRRKLFAQQCRKFKVPLFYVNQTGGNDELVFDGFSCAFDSQGDQVAQGKGFSEDMLLVDLDDLNAARQESVPDDLQCVHDALVMGLRDYVRKCGFESVVVGLSGGIDSALTAAIAVEALGSENVLGVAMPSRYSSIHSVSDARALAENSGIRFMTIPIEKAHVAMEETMKDAFSGCEQDSTEENIQARLRGTILMALSNKFGSMLLATGNKSELSVGYCTLYGDMCGGLSVIGDVPKMMVYELAGYINRHGEVIPQSTVSKPPSAELKPDQKDSDALPSYEILDAILQLYVEQDRSVDEIVDSGFNRQVVEKVTRLVDVNEYKRKQAASALKVTTRAFGSGRRIPIAQKYRP